MLKLFFEPSYIIVVPFYSETAVHSHNMLHVFFGNEKLNCLVDGVQISGRLLILENDVVHKSPEGEIAFFLFVDPTSTFAELLREKYLKGKSSFAVDLPDNNAMHNKQELTEEIIKNKVAALFGDISFSKKENMDERILQLVNSIDDFKHLGARVSDLAKKYCYSESYLTHLFKNETGIALKSYLLMRQFEYVWHKIMEGQSLTQTSLDAGFSSPSHFSDVCRKLTGISVTKVLEKKADF